MSTRVVKVTVINDLICPNCYIGFQELLLAVQQCTNLPITFDIEYRPFCLNSNIPEDTTIDKKPFYADKYGAENVKAKNEALLDWGREIGLDLNFEDGVISSTVRAHRLSVKAYRLGGQLLQIPLLAAIFKAYTIDSKDIGSLDVLGDAAESAGVMSKEQAIEFLKGDELKDEVMKMTEVAKAKGVKGVPLVIIDGRWAVSGGQRAEIFVQIFKKLAAAATATADVAQSPLPTPLIEARACAA